MFFLTYIFALSKSCLNSTLPPPEIRSLNKHEKALSSSTDLSSNHIIRVDQKDLFTKPNLFSSERNKPSSISVFCSRIEVYAFNGENKNGFNISVDGTESTVKFPQNQKDQESQKVFSIDLPYGPHTLTIHSSNDLIGDDQLSSFHFANFYTAGAEETVMVPSYANIIPYSFLSYDKNSWEEIIGNDGNGKGIRSTTSQATLTIQFAGNRFWLEGTVGPDYGEISVSVDGSSGTLVNLNRANEENNFVVYYDSKSIEHNAHTVTLTCRSPKVTFSRLFYNMIKEQNIVQNTTGLIRTQLDSDIHGWNKGTMQRWTETPNASASFSFIGTKVYLLHKAGDYGTIDIYIDEIYYETVDLSIGSDLTCRFSSPDLPYGPHTIRIVKTPVSTNTKRVAINAFLYRPHPYPWRLCIPVYDLTSNSTLWDKDDSKPPGIPIRSAQANKTGASFEFQFTGIRFYLTGKSENSFIGTGFTVRINSTEKNCSAKTSYPNQLLYKSDILPFGVHTVVITALDTRCKFNDVIYCQQPEDKAIFYPNEFILNGSWNQSLDHPYYFTKTYKDSAQTKLYCKHFWIITRKWTTGGTIEGYFNDDRDPKFRVSIYHGNKFIAQEHVIGPTHDNIKPTLPLDYYSVRFVSHESGKWIFFTYILYDTGNLTATPENNGLPLKEKLPVNFECNGYCTLNEDSLSTNQLNQKITIKYDGTKFWIECLVGPNSGSALIYIDESETEAANISFYRPKADKFILFESPDLDMGRHTISIVNRLGNEIAISKFIYRPAPPTLEFSPSTLFSPSNAYTRSLSFSNSNTYTASTKFTSSETYTKSTEFTQSDPYTESANFTCSNTYSQSNHFTKSHTFTKTKSFSSTSDFTISRQFTTSFEFSLSSEFTTSFQFTPTNDNSPRNEKGDKSSIALIAGLVVGIVAIILIVIIIAIVILKKRKKEEPSFDENATEVDSMNLFSSQQVNNTMDDDAFSVNSVMVDVFDQNFNLHEEDENDA